jgi:hypothetical protein
LPVTPTLNVTPTWPGSRGATRKNVSVSDAVRGRRWTVGRSPALRFYDLEFSDRPDAETSEVQALWEGNYPDLPVFWTDAFVGQERKFLFDAKFHRERAGRLYHNYKLSLREVAVYAPGSASAVSSVFPYVPDYGYEMEFGKESFSSEAWDWSRAARAEEGTQKRRVELTFYGRPAAEFLAAEGFWIYHYPGRELTFLHAAPTGLAGQFLIDSEFSWEYASNSLVNYKFIAREV